MFVIGKPVVGDKIEVDQETMKPYKTLTLRISIEDMMDVKTLKTEGAHDEFKKELVEAVDKVVGPWFIG